MGAESKEIGMTMHRGSSGTTIMFGVLIFLFASATVFAQAGSETPAPSVASPEASPTQNVDAVATKAHDDSFVIGNDDVLAINV